MNYQSILIVIGCFFFLAGGILRAIELNDFWFGVASVALFVVNYILWLR